MRDAESLARAHAGTGVYVEVVDFAAVTGATVVVYDKFTRPSGRHASRRERVLAVVRDGEQTAAATVRLPTPGGAPR